jgi:hypothetical protein
MEVGEDDDGYLSTKGGRFVWQDAVPSLFDLSNSFPVPKGVDADEGGIPVGITAQRSQSDSSPRPRFLPKTAPGAPPPTTPNLLRPAYNHRIRLV